MTLAILIVIAAAIALAAILGISVSRSLQVSADPGLAGQIRPIDIEAFRNLLDPAEDEYLRRRLSASEFRTVRRQRLRAMAAYTRVAGCNAAILIRLGQAAVATGDASIDDAARQLVDDALLLRRNAAFALLRIYLVLAWPQASFAANPILNNYRHLNNSAMLLGRLRNPAAVVRISA